MKTCAAKYPQLAGRWLGVLVFWGLIGVYPACSDAEFTVSAQDGSAGGGRGGSGGSNGGSSGRDASESDGDTDASAGRGGSAGTGSGGSAGTLPEAGPDTGDARADTSADAPFDAPTDTRPTCDAPLEYFLDADHDTYGDDSTMLRACDPPSGDWVLRGGDCRDDLPKVNPDQDDYMPEGYETTQGVSFDYDCSGLEEPDPESFGAAPASCPLLPPCNTQQYPPGYVPGPRSGLGVNALCGSQLLRGCVANGALGCAQQQTATTAAKRCR
ncbi:MAG TPA: hypothetical protein VI072_05990 [Polyangiaceae bacterium]